MKRLRPPSKYECDIKHCSLRLDMYGSDIEADKVYRCNRSDETLEDYKWCPYRRKVKELDKIGKSLLQQAVKEGKLPKELT